MSTIKGNKIFLHILDFKKNQLIIDDLNEKIKKVTYYNSNLKVDFKFKKSVLTINLDRDQMNDIDTIIEITLKD